MKSDQTQRPRRMDSGTSLVEIVVAIVLTGTLVLAIVNAVAVAVGTSAEAEASAETSTVLLNASDRVNRAPQLCDYEVYADAAALEEQQRGWDPSMISTTVELLVANTGSESDWQTQNCPDDIDAFEVQRITITATDPSGSITKTLTVVKSDVS